MSRTSDMLAIIGRYPELAAAGVSFPKIVEQCCRRIPQTGIADGRTGADVLEVACERAVVAMAEGRLQGTAIANYIVIAFKGMAADGIPDLAGLTRAGLATEVQEIRRACEAQDRERADRARRPAPIEPTKVREALIRLSPRPDVGDFPRVGRVVPPLKPNPYRDIETEHCEHISDALPHSLLRENAEAAHELEAKTKAVVEDAAKRRGAA